jgi:hypothetical protein
MRRQIASQLSVCSGCGEWGAHFVNFAQDGTESCRKCIALFGEQRVAGLRTLKTGFGVRERHPCWEDGLAWASARHDEDVYR